MHTIEFTKVFAEGSLLDGLTYRDKLTNATRHDVSRYIQMAEEGSIVNTGAFGGSDYVIADVVIRCH